MAALLQFVTINLLKNALDLLYCNQGKRERQENKMTLQEIYTFQRENLDNTNVKALEFIIEKYLAAVRKGH